jgi:hypothetical protein
MLAGEVPYQGRNYADLVLQIITGGAPSLANRVPGMPASLSAVVHRAMALDRAQRHQDVSALAADLRAFAAGAPLEVPRVSHSRTSREAATPFATEAARESDQDAAFLPKRHTGALLLGIAAGCVLVGLGLWALQATTAPSARQVVSAAMATPPPAAAPSANPVPEASPPTAPAVFIPPAAAPSLDPRHETNAQPAAARPADKSAPSRLGTEPRERDDLPGIRQAGLPAPQAAPTAPVVTITRLPESEPSAAQHAVSPEPAPQPAPKHDRARRNDAYQIRDERLIDPFER